LTFFDKFHVTHDILPKIPLKKISDMKIIVYAYDSYFVKSSFVAFIL